MQSIFSPVEFEEYLLLKTRDFSDDINDETTRKQWREVYLASQIQTLISPSVAYTAHGQRICGQKRRKHRRNMDGHVGLFQPAENRDLSHSYQVSEPAAFSA